jgi:hypothetical protein
LRDLVLRIALILASASQFDAGRERSDACRVRRRHLDNYEVATLVVDVFDTKAKALVWRGASSDTLSKDSAKNIKNLDNGVQKIFDHFPPDAKK